MLWDDPDGWDGVGKRETSKREGIYVYILDDHFMYSRNQHNIVKQLYANKN